MKRKLVAEGIGTYILVFAGTGACVVDEMTGKLTHIGVSLAFGLVVLALIYAFGHISGAHLNPAVSIALACHRTIDWRTCFYYIVVQCAAAVGASMTVSSLFDQTTQLGATIPSGSSMQSFVMEFLLTFMLMMVIYASSLHQRSVRVFAGVAIGSTVCVEAMFGGPISGASMNPARSLGPALVSGELTHLWIYVIATIGGALAATWVYRWISEEAVLQEDDANGSHTINE